MMLEIFQKIVGKRNYFFAFIWKIKIGKGAIFYGRTHFRRQNNSLISIGTNCTFRSAKNSNWIGINRPCMISTQGHENASIQIGDNCGFSGTVIGAFKSINLGNNVRCGANTLITDSDWHLDDPRSGPPKEVYIDDDVWLGVNSVVLKGVRIGKNSIIGANSVVTTSIPDNVIAAGNPCKVIRDLQKV